MFKSYSDIFDQVFRREAAAPSTPIAEGRGKSLPHSCPPSRCAVCEGAVLCGVQRK